MRRDRLRRGIVVVLIATASGLSAAPAGGSPAPATLTGPVGGTTLLPGHRIVALYGEAGTPALGVLGDAAPSVMWQRLVVAAAPYESPGDPVVRAFELIAFPAQGSPGLDGDYTAEIAASVIEEYLSVVRSHGGLLILDIQPGRSSMLADAERLEPWLAQPDVGLALDPEWELGPDQLPLRQIGHTDAAELNQVSSWLAGVVRAHHLPQKLLLVHDFTPEMVQDKAAVLPRAGLATVFNMDGFGSSADKIAAYHVLATDDRFPLGFKLFYQRDEPLLSPAAVMALQPSPAVVEYE